MKRCFSHGGNIKEMAVRFRLREDDIIDFSSNVNSFNFPTGIKKIIADNIKDISRYPDPESSDLKQALSKQLKISGKNIIIGNGSTELIYQTVSAFKPRLALLVSPTFSEYEKALLNAGAKIKYLQLKEKNEFEIPVREVAESARQADMVFLCNPNNPTGRIVKREDLINLLKKSRLRKAILVLDEAFIDLAEENSLVDFSPNNNLLILRSMTKFFGLASLRLGYAVGGGKLIEKLGNFKPPWTVNVFAQKAGEALVRDKKFKKMSRSMLLKEREFLYGRLCRIKGLKAYSSRANFILVRITKNLSSRRVQEGLLRRGILVRDCSNFRGLRDKFIRVAVRGRRDNLSLLKGLSIVLRDK